MLAFKVGFGSIQCQTNKIDKDRLYQLSNYFKTNELANMS